MSDTPSNAVFLIAAIAVIIFSLVGVGVMTGVIPSSLSRSGDPQVAAKTARTDATSPDHSSTVLAQRKSAVGASASLRAAGKGTHIAPAQPCAGCGRIEAVSLVAQGVAAPGLGPSPGLATGPNNARRYEVLVRLEDGTVRIFSYDTQPEFRAGDAVRIIDGALTAD